MGATVPTILLVEGDDFLRGFLTRVLRECGCAVQGVSNYKEGLTQAQFFCFSLCLIDVTLPDGSGIDLCRQIHAINGGVPVVICYGGDGHDRMALQAEAQASLKIGDYMTYQLHRLIDQLVGKGTGVGQPGCCA